jgi:TRAP-type uncharacterized transport system fused permease subunit
MINTTAASLLEIIAAAILGMYLFAASIQGFLLIKTRLWERISLLVIAILLIKPGLMTDIIGAGWLASIVFIQIMRKKVKMIGS